MNRGLASVLVAVLMSLGFAFVSSPAHAADEVMTGEQQAGDYYLTQACRSGIAADRFYDKIWGDRETLKWDEVRRRFDQIRNESYRYGNARIRFATKLMNPPAAWPVEVGEEVNRFADASIKYGQFLRRMGNAQGIYQWGRLWVKAKKVPFGNLSTTIRAELNLPPSGQGC